MAKTGRKNRVELTRDEAEWTLEVLDGLFDYYIVGPERDAKRRAAMDEKIERAGRKPIRPRQNPEDGRDG